MCRMCMHKYIHTHVCIYLKCMLVCCSALCVFVCNAMFCAHCMTSAIHTAIPYNFLCRTTCIRMGSERGEGEQWTTAAFVAAAAGRSSVLNRVSHQGACCIFTRLYHQGCCVTDNGVSSLVWSTKAVVGRILVCLL